jgi:SnoaL-like domain
VTRAPALFTDDAVYRSASFREPYRGDAEIRAYWRRGAAAQRDVHVTHGASVRRRRPGRGRVVDDDERSDDGEVTLPGCLLLRFAPDGRCAELREYWHVQPGLLEPHEGWGA